MNWRPLLWPLVVAFMVVEAAGIVFTEEMAGTLTDTSADYLPEDIVFLLMGAMFWRLTQWSAGHPLMQLAEFVLAFWLLQHFIRHFTAKVYAKVAARHMRSEEHTSE